MNIVRTVTAHVKGIHSFSQPTEDKEHSPQILRLGLYACLEFIFSGYISSNIPGNQLILHCRSETHDLPLKDPEVSHQNWFCLVSLLTYKQCSHHLHLEAKNGLFET